MNSETTRENSIGPEEVAAFGWRIQRGYVYSVVYGEDAPASIEGIDGEARSLGYHGADVPPCGAAYLYEDDETLLVISAESDPTKIPAFDGVAMERVTLEAGDCHNDGTWQFRVLGVAGDGETVIAGKC